AADDAPGKNPAAGNRLAVRVIPRPLSADGEIASALRHLRATDPILARVIDAHDSPTFQCLLTPFHSLARSILYQQLAIKAAASIYARFLALCGGEAGLRQIGVSERKASYLHDLARKYHGGILSDATIVAMDDKSLFSMLTMVKGIGAWSVHMFMMFCLHRPDVLPVGDLGVRKGVQMLYGLDDVPRPSQMEQLCERKSKLILNARRSLPIHLNHLTPVVIVPSDRHESHLDDFTHSSQRHLRLPVDGIVARTGGLQCGGVSTTSSYREIRTPQWPARIHKPHSPPITTVHRKTTKGVRGSRGAIGIPASSSSSSGYKPSLVRGGSAFSKPTLFPSTSLVSPRGEGDAGGAGVGSGDQAAISNSSPGAAGVGLSADNSKPTTIAKTSTITAATSAAYISTKYKECLRNHAAALGGHVVDGCGEFMPSGDPDSPEALKCAACGCHRSFHRRETDGSTGTANSYYHGTTRLPLLLPPPHPQAHNHHQQQFQLGGFSSSPSAAVRGTSGFVHFGGSNPSGSGGTTTESSSEERLNTATPTPTTIPRKRFRTKFTAEQKENMLAFAERVGWRFQRQDDAMVEQFCAEIGVRR
ncbi:unnamed protein product, partial [Musa acuminata subsp. burmannicoides]